MDPRITKALKHLRLAAETLHEAATAPRELEATAEVYHRASLLLLTLKNALESGTAYPVMIQGERFDFANQAREDQLYVNPEVRN